MPDAAARSPRRRSTLKSRAGAAGSPRGSSNGSKGRRSRGAVGATEFRRAFDEILGNITKVIRGKDDVVRLALVALLSEGHVLFEDVPGTGKSMLARALSQTINGIGTRIQCTPDMLPSDITGNSILNKSGGFDFKRGPVFANILLVDEINRATPKTQSALLESMAERKVTSDGVTRPLPEPFVVLATENPVEHAGTFPLPEAQLDRFLFRLSMGYMDKAHEKAVMFANSAGLSIEQLGPVVDTDVILRLIDFATSVEASDEVGTYIVDLVHASRDDASCALGSSPRASIGLLRAARALAAADGRDHVYPDDVKFVMPHVLGHRLVLHPEAMLRGETVDDVLERINAAVKAPQTKR